MLHVNTANYFFYFLLNIIIFIFGGPMNIEIVIACRLTDWLTIETQKFTNKNFAFFYFFVFCIFLVFSLRFLLLFAFHWWCVIFSHMQKTLFKIPSSFCVDTFNIESTGTASNKKKKLFVFLLALKICCIFLTWFLLFPIFSFFLFFSYFFMLMTDDERTLY